MKVNNVEWNKDFAPSYLPHELLEMGIFDGKYFNDIKGEFPASWFKNAKMVNPHELPNPELSYFKVSSSQSLSTWEDKGWIMTDDHGWMQWYFNYFLGRRLGEEDEKQIKRWRGVINRHMGQIKSPKDLTPKRGQALLHWAWNYEDKPTEEIFKKNLNKLKKYK